MSNAKSWLKEEARKPLKNGGDAKGRISAENATEHGESDLGRGPVHSICSASKKDAIIASLNQGATVVAACAAATISTPTFYRWRVKDEEFREATDAAQETATARVEDSVFRQATDSDKPNIVAGIFWLCNRAPKRWKHVNRVEVTGTDGQDLTVVLRGMAAKREELAKRWAGGGNGDGADN